MRMVLLFWCRLTQVVLEKRPLNECSVVVVVVVCDYLTVPPPDNIAIIGLSSSSGFVKDVSSHTVPSVAGNMV